MEVAEKVVEQCLENITRARLSAAQPIVAASDRGFSRIENRKGAYAYDVAVVWDLEYRALRQLPFSGASPLLDQDDVTTWYKYGLLCQYLQTNYIHAVMFSPLIRGPRGV